MQENQENNTPSVANLIKFLEVVMDGENPYEVATIGANGAAGKAFYAAADVVAWLKGAVNNPNHKGIYIIPSPLDTTSKGYPHTRGWGGRASDAHILKRRVLFIDVDPNQTNRERKDGGGVLKQCSDDLELAGAKLYAEMIVAKLGMMGWPEPVVICSGNGYQLFYRWEGANSLLTPNPDPATKPTNPDLELAKAFMRALESAMGAAQVPKKTSNVPIDLEARSGLGALDDKVVNAGRLCRLPETWNRKGEPKSEPLEGRPFRLARVMNIPDGWAESALTDDDIEVATGLLEAEVQSRGLVGPDGLKAEKVQKVKRGRKSSVGAVVDHGAEAPVVKAKAKAKAEKVHPFIKAILDATEEQRIGLGKELIKGIEPIREGEGGYNDWLALAGNLWALVGEKGRELFVELSVRGGGDASEAGAKFDSEAQGLCSDRAKEIKVLCDKYTKDTGRLAVTLLEGCGIEYNSITFKPGTYIEDNGDGSLLAVSKDTAYWFDINGPCYKVVRKTEVDSEPFFIKEEIGAFILPRACYRGRNGYGLQLDYRGYARGVELATEVRSVAGGSNHARSKAADELSNNGIVAEDDKCGDLVRGLLYWRNIQQKLGIPPKTLTTIQGWQADGLTYANGPRFVGKGADGYLVDTHFVNLRYKNFYARGKLRGDIMSWMSACESVYNTPALRFCIGFSLAGAALGLLGVTTWGVHLYGPSSKGKSTALAVAGSVWGYCDNESKVEGGFVDPTSAVGAVIQDLTGDNQGANLFTSWKGTAAGLECRAAGMSGAMVILDDIGAMDRAHDVVETVIHIGNGKSKERQHEDWPSVTWLCTILSSGEQSVHEVCQGQIQTGAMARLVDLEFKGEADVWLRDAAHSEQCKETARQTYGVAGQAWVDALASADGVARRMLKTRFDEAKESMQRRAKDIGGAANRIIGYAAAVEATLRVAAHYGVLPFLDQEIEQAMDWFLQAVEGREAKTQEEMAWNTIMRKVRTDAVMTEEQWRHKIATKGKYAVEGHCRGTEALLTTADMLGNAVQELGLKVSIKPFMQWAQDKGLLVSLGQFRVGTRMGRFLEMKGDPQEESDDRLVGSHLPDDLGDYDI